MSQVGATSQQAQLAALSALFPPVIGRNARERRRMRRAQDRLKKEIEASIAVSNPSALPSFASLFSQLPSQAQTPTQHCPSLYPSLHDSARQAWVPPAHGGYSQPAAFGSPERLQYPSHNLSIVPAQFNPTDRCGFPSPLSIPSTRSLFESEPILSGYSSLAAVGCDDPEADNFDDLDHLMDICVQGGLVSRKTASLRQSSASSYRETGGIYAGVPAVSGWSSDFVSVGLSDAARWSPATSASDLSSTGPMTPEDVAIALPATEAFDCGKYAA